MDTTLSADNPRFAFFIADMLMEWKNGFGDAQMAHLCSVYLGEPTRILIFQPQQNHPAILMGRSDNTTLFLFLGAMSSNIIGAVSAGYFLPYRSRDANGLHHQAMSTADVTYPAYLAEFTSFRDRIIIGGYSWGGACSQALGYRVRFIKPDAVISVCTFGSPKVADNRGPLVLNGLDLCRWMNVGDEVCLVPPPPNKAPLMYALLRLQDQQSLQEFQQIGQGRILNVDSTITPSLQISTPRIFADARLANFLLTSSASVAVEHRIDLYQQRLNTWIMANPEVQPIVRARAAQDDVIPQQHRRDQPNPELQMPGAPIGPIRNPDDDEWAEALPIAAAIAALPPRQAVDSPSPPYYYVRLNGAHTVESQDVTIAVCRTQRQAKAMARSLNLSLKKWNGALVGDAETFAVLARENFID